MRAGLLSALHPHFSAHLSLLRSEAVKSVKTALEKKAPGEAFGAVAAAAREAAVGAFAAAAEEAAPAAAAAEEWGAAAKQVHAKVCTLCCASLCPCIVLYCCVVFSSLMLCCAKTRENCFSQSSL